MANKPDLLSAPLYLPDFKYIVRLFVMFDKLSRIGRFRDVTITPESRIWFEFYLSSYNPYQNQGWNPHECGKQEKFFVTYV